MIESLSAAAVAERLDSAATAAVLAGSRLLALRQSGRWAGEVLGDLGDQSADGFLQGFLRGRYPNDALLSEETCITAGRTEKRCCWIVDPLDGTKEYRSGRHVWAVHVGLAVDGEAALGAVALPAVDLLLVGCCLPGQERLELRSGMLGGNPAADPGVGWPRELIRGHSPMPGRWRLAVSRSHTPAWVERLAAALGGAVLVPSGSVGVKVAMLLLGQADAYAHRPGLKEWDTCAPEAVARAAGWAVGRLDGQRQRYNQPDPRNEEMVVCRPSQWAELLAAMAVSAPA
jgi:3'(2'), 5'-bisphosphate nucleotidase